MTATITKVSDVQRLGERLTIVTVDGPNGDPVGVIANLRDDGTPRWEVGELCVYISEGSIIPDDLLKERGYWNDEKDRGFLDGNKYNRVKRRKMAGVETVGLLFKVGTPGEDWSDELRSFWIDRGDNTLAVSLGDDVTEFFGITHP